MTGVFFYVLTAKTWTVIQNISIKRCSFNNFFYFKCVSRNIGTNYWINMQGTLHFSIYFLRPVNYVSSFCHFHINRKFQWPNFCFDFVYKYFKIENIFPTSTIRENSCSVIYDFNFLSLWVSFSHPKMLCLQNCFPFSKRNVYGECAFSHREREIFAIHYVFARTI